MRVVSAKNSKGNVIVNAETETGSRYQIELQKQFLPLSVSKCEEKFRIFYQKRQKLLMLQSLLDQVNHYTAFLPGVVDRLKMIAAITPSDIDGIKTTSNSGVSWEEYSNVSFSSEQVLKNLFNQQAFLTKDNNGKKMDVAIEIDLYAIHKHTETAMSRLDVSRNVPFIIDESIEDVKNAIRERAGLSKEKIMITEPEKIEMADRALTLMRNVGDGVREKIEALPDGQKKTLLLERFKNLQNEVIASSNKKSGLSAEQNAELSLKVLEEQIRHHL